MTMGRWPRTQLFGLDNVVIVHHWHIVQIRSQILATILKHYRGKSYIVAASVVLGQSAIVVTPFMQMQSHGILMPDIAANAYFTFDIHGRILSESIVSSFIGSRIGLLIQYFAIWSTSSHQIRLSGSSFKNSVKWNNLALLIFTWYATPCCGQFVNTRAKSWFDGRSEKAVGCTRG
jgi:hypothetical protein